MEFEDIENNNDSNNTISTLNSSQGTKMSTNSEMQSDQIPSNPKFCSQLPFSQNTQNIYPSQSAINSSQPVQKSFFGGFGNSNQDNNDMAEFLKNKPNVFQKLEVNQNKRILRPKKKIITESLSHNSKFIENCESESDEEYNPNQENDINQLTNQESKESISSYISENEDEDSFAGLVDETEEDSRPIDLEDYMKYRDQL